MLSRQRRVVSNFRRLRLPSDRIKPFVRADLSGGDRGFVFSAHFGERGQRFKECERAFQAFLMAGLATTVVASCSSLRGLPCEI